MVFLCALIYVLPVQGDAPSFILIHLDAISFADFQRELEAGNLPNIERVFTGGGSVLKGLSTFPGGTQMIVPRMKTGTSNEFGEPVGWGIYDESTGEMTDKPDVFLQFAPAVERRARGCFVNILPPLEVQAWLSLYNLPRYLDTYNVLEFYWFTTDFYGHYLGERLHNASIRRFDFFFGQMVDQIDLDTVNVLIYGDHGMTFTGVERVPYERIVEELLEGKMLGSRYPHVFLSEGVEPSEVAHILAEHDEICLAFYNEPHGQVIGYHSEGTIMLHRCEEGRIRYAYTGKDYFGYYDEGYDGEYLDAQEWLDTTLHTTYPGAPPNIYGLLSNPSSGQVVSILNPPRIFADELATMFPINKIGGFNHSGLADTDLLVPVLLRGPELEHLYDRESIWLHELYGSIPDLGFEDIEPSREQHGVQLGMAVGDVIGPSLSLSFSPAYRWQTLLQYRQGEITGGVAYDLYSSYLLRLWLEAGLSYGNGGVKGHILPQLTFSIGSFDIGFKPGLWQRDNEFRVQYGIGDWTLWWQMPGELGLGFAW